LLTNTPRPNSHLPKRSWQRKTWEGASANAPNLPLNFNHVENFSSRIQTLKLEAAASWVQEVGGCLSFNFPTDIANL